MSVLSKDIEKRKRDNLSWKFAGYIDPMILKEQLANESIEARVKDAKFERRRIEAYGDANIELAKKGYDAYYVPDDLEERVDKYIAECNSSEQDNKSGKITFQDIKNAGKNIEKLER